MTDEAAMASMRDQSYMFMTDLGRFEIVDIGVITNIDEAGRATVASNKFVAGAQVVYEDVEILWIGGDSCHIETKGALCLLFSPRNNIYDTKEAKVPIESTPYDISCIKALPLSNGSSSLMRLIMDENGVITIEPVDTEQPYSVSFSTAGVNISTPDTTLSWNSDGLVSALVGKGLYQYIHDVNGNKIDIYYNTEGKISYAQFVAPDGTITRYHTAYKELEGEQLDDPSIYTKYMWKEEWNPDGSHSITQVDDKDNPLFREEYAADGTRTTTFGDNKLTIEEKTDGTVTYTNEQAISYTTKQGYTIKADGAINIESTKQELITIKNSVASLKDILDELIDDVAGMKTTGSPAAHTVSPDDVTKLNALKTSKVDLVFG